MRVFELMLEAFNMAGESLMRDSDPKSAEYELGQDLLMVNKIYVARKQREMLNKIYVAKKQREKELASLENKPKET